jgi:hypothetical protein
MTKQEEFQTLMNKITALIRAGEVTDTKQSIPLIKRLINLFYEIEQAPNSKPFVIDYADSKGEVFKVPALGAYMNVVQIAFDLEPLTRDRDLITPYTRQYYNTVKQSGAY